MPKHGTTSFPDWYIRFQQAALAALPRPPLLDQDTGLVWADSGEAMTRAFATVFLPQREKSVEPHLPTHKSPLLEWIGKITIPAMTKRFTARDKFVLNYGVKPGVCISYLGDNFKNWFLGRIEEPTVEMALLYERLTRSELDGFVLAELGDRKETTLAQIYALMERQPKGGGGALLINGWANVFYVPDANGVLRAVRVRWYGDGWGVDASSVEGPGGLDDGSQVFSRNSSVAVAV